MAKFDELRAQYPSFIYKDFSVEHKKTSYRVLYHFSIPGLSDFESVWEFPVKEKVNEDILQRLFFHLGMVETISYWKCACPKKLIVQCAGLTEEQCAWWKKLFYHGLGEFLYRNNIEVSQEELVQIECQKVEESPLKDDKTYAGCLVPVGGGKDSVVSLELLKNEKIMTYCINGNQTTDNIVKVCGHQEDDYVAKRILDKRLLELNAQGYLNGHIPFSAVVAFSTVITAFLCGKKYIALSNETSANETTVRDSFVNHQYSKSFEFEQDFAWYVKSITDSDIHYFSLLRPLAEIQIAWLFSKCEKYHKVFRSCNVGSKQGIWCCNCPKCLFVYIILTPFLNKGALIDIFGENLLDKESLDLNFRELMGLEENKPFECVGTRKEVLVALKSFVNSGGKSLLTERYKDAIMKESAKIQDMLGEWVSENRVPVEYESLLKRCMEQ